MRPATAAQMNALEHEGILFSIEKLKIPFTRLFIDQTLEQEKKVSKRHGGMVG